MTAADPAAIVGDRTGTRPYEADEKEFDLDKKMPPVEGGDDPDPDDGDENPDDSEPEPDGEDAGASGGERRPIARKTPIKFALMPSLVNNEKIMDFENPSTNRIYYKITAPLN